MRHVDIVMPDPRAGASGLGLSPCRADPPRFGRSYLLVLVTLMAVAGLALSVSPASSEAAVETGRVQGRVTAKATGGPVAGATVELPDFGATAVSGRDGRFAFDEPLPSRSPFRPILAVVTSPGFGRWTIQDAPLVPGDVLLLNVELRPRPWTHTVAAPGSRGAEKTGETRHTGTCTGWTAQLVPPKRIKVFITDEGKAAGYDFRFYVQHVLPNEWIPSWHPNALAAGAIAAKTYGWFHTKRNHAYSSGEGCADVLDDARDQVFDPSWSTAATNQAVDTSFGSVLWKGGGIFESQYWSGSPGDPCEPVLEGQYAGRMSQYGTQTCATVDGLDWPAIVTTFYQQTTWSYLRNLLLNPNVENSPMYPWVGQGSTRVTRVNGGAHSGSWYLTVEAPITSTLYQAWPFGGKASTTYHLETALRCGPENATACTIKLKVIAKSSTGSKTGIKKVTIPRDGNWYVQTYDPGSPGIDHSTIQVNWVTNQTVGVDTSLLTASTG